MRFTSISVLLCTLSFGLVLASTYDDPNGQALLVKLDKSVTPNGITYSTDKYDCTKDQAHCLSTGGRFSPANEVYVQAVNGTKATCDSKYTLKEDGTSRTVYTGLCHSDEPTTLLVRCRYPGTDVKPVNGSIPNAFAAVYFQKIGSSFEAYGGAQARFIRDHHHKPAFSTNGTQAFLPPHVEISCPRHL